MPRTRPSRVAAALAALLLSLTALTACSDDSNGGSRSGGGDDTTTSAGGGSTDAGSGATTPDPDWTISDPEAEGFDPDALEAIRVEQFAPENETQGIVIVRNGVIAAEWYADGADADSWAASWSVGKSFAGSLIGIAIEEGHIEGVDEPMTTWFPEWEQRGLGDITLRHVLQMSDGLRWTEDYDANRGMSDIISLVTSGDDHLAVVEALEAEHPPGEVFNYSSGTSMLLSGVIEAATGRSAGDYAREVLFEPLGFSKVDWWEDPHGHTLTYCCVDTTSRDFARFGLLYLRGGLWGDEQIVPESWVEASVTPSPTADFYGYQWWMPTDAEGIPADAFSARGHDGQFIFVVPSLDLVVARNGTYDKDPGDPVAEPTLFSRYPPQGLIEGRGTVPPTSDWEPEALLASVIAAIDDDTADG